MIFPTIHLNGTSGADLQSLQTDAMIALSDAIKALVTAFAQAQAQHEDRLARLEAVQAELVAIAELITAQMTERERGRSC
jgi:phage shock protein A